MSRANFSPGDFTRLASAEAGFWWFRARNRVILWGLSTKLTPFSSFLEIGCGTGYVLKAIADAHPNVRIEAGDYYTEAFPFARQRVPQAVFRQIDATSFMVERRVDVIGLFDVLEHIEDDARALANVERALSDQGSVIVTVPQHPGLWSSTDEKAGHVRRYTRDELIRKIEAAGLSIDYVTSFVTLLFPILCLVRKRKKKHEDVMTEFRIAAPLNKALEMLMRVELFLLRLGVVFPFGGSLLCIAHKPRGK